MCSIFFYTFSHWIFPLKCLDLKWIFDRIQLIWAYLSCPRIKETSQEVKLPLGIVDPDWSVSGKWLWLGLLAGFLFIYYYYYVTLLGNRLGSIGKWVRILMSLDICVTRMGSKREWICNIDSFHPCLLKNIFFSLLWYHSFRRRYFRFDFTIRETNRIYTIAMVILLLFFFFVIKRNFFWKTKMRHNNL